MPDEPSRPGSILFGSLPPEEPVAEEPVRSSPTAATKRWLRRLRRLGLRPLRWRWVHRLRPGVRRSLVWTTIAVVALLAGSVVSFTTIDLGPSLRAQAERAFADYIDRSVTIGRLSTYLAPGRFLVEDLEIGGLNPGDRPFFQADRLTISTAWGPLLQGEVLVDAVELSGWRMLVEGFADGRQTFPRFVPRADGDEQEDTPSPTGDSGGAAAEEADTGRRIVTTVQHLRAHDGEFVYEDHGAPWSIRAPNIDLTLGKSTGYGGTARFRGGTLVIGDFEPMTLNMDAEYLLDGGFVDLTHIDLWAAADGFRATVDGRVDMLNWPESTYHVRRMSIDLPAMKEIFFARDNFTVTGEGAFTGAWHLFKGGRELTGSFASADATLSGLRFPELDGDLVWTRDRFEITRAHSDFYGGELDFTYAMKPLGAPEPGVATFRPQVRSANLEPLLADLDVRGARPRGRLAGELSLSWPLGRFAERSGGGEVSVRPPRGVELLPRDVPPVPRAGWPHGEQPFAPAAAPWRFPFGGEMRFTFEEDGVGIAPSWFATPLTAMSFQGRTAWGEGSRIAFDVLSADWQESDRVMAAVMTAFGRPTGELTLDGHGTMTGVMLGSLASPRVEAAFAGDAIRAWNVEWGRGEGDIVVEDGMLEVTNGRFLQAASSMTVDGRFAIGAARPGREQMNARFAVDGLPAQYIRDAFSLDGYTIDGPTYGQIRLYGAYAAPLGFGRLRLGAGVAYGEPFDEAEADLRFDSGGVLLNGLTVRQGDGEVTGAMYVQWDGTYSVTADMRGLDLSASRMAERVPMPVTGRMEATLSGAGAFADPRYEIRGAMTDVSIAGATVGQVTGRLDVEAGVMAVELKAASPGVAVSGSGRIGLESAAPAQLRFSVTNTRLDPFARAVQPGLSEMTALVASGTVAVDGTLLDVERLDVDVAVDRLALTVFDFALENDGPVRLSLADNALRVDRMRLRGEGTNLELSGEVTLADERLALRAEGNASLGILEGLIADVRSRGTMRLTADIGGSLEAPIISGEARVRDGRIRHLALPHALDAVNGRVVLEPGGIRFDELSAQLGGGSVSFGGRVGLQGYGVGDLNVTAAGRGIALRYPEGIRSRVDADLTLRGSVDTPTLGGLVTVHDAIWMELFQADGGFLDFLGDQAVADPAESSLPLRFDLRISAPSSLRIADNRAQIVASADLTLTGTYDRPSLLGNAEIERGQLYFQGNRYRLTRGSVGFANPMEMEPFLDVEAETDIRVPGQTYRVTLGLAGPLDRLEPPTLESDPPLQQFEIIGLLLGDVRDPQQAEIRTLRAPEASQQGLLMQGIGTGLLNNPVLAEVGGVVERSFGVDTFEITPSLDDPAAQQSTELVPTARVLIGKRISERAHLTFSRTVSGSNQDLIVVFEYDATDRLSWVLSQNEDRTYALDVRVRHAF